MRCSFIVVKWLPCALPYAFQIVVVMEMNLEYIFISTICIILVIVGCILYAKVAPVACILLNRLLLLLLLLSLLFYIKSYYYVAS